MNDLSDRVCETNTECLVDGNTRTCQCDASLEWSTAHQICLHPDGKRKSNVLKSSILLLFDGFIY